MPSIEVLIAASMLLLNIGALVWGAAKLATNLEHVAKALEKLTQVVDTIDKRVNRHETRISLLERDETSLAPRA